MQSSLLIIASNLSRVFSCSAFGVVLPMACATASSAALSIYLLMALLGKADTDSVSFVEIAPVSPLSFGVSCTLSNRSALRGFAVDGLDVTVVVTDVRLPSTPLSSLGTLRLLILRNGHIKLPVRLGSSSLDLTVDATGVGSCDSGGDVDKRELSLMIPFSATEVTVEVRSAASSLSRSYSVIAGDVRRVERVSLSRPSPVDGR
mmetsp:Transcript_3250/g.5058  ORF Transcript_3250/g.5058 Transcript_3250/m.5058 type:complete len:204 (+) Transcript_3250:172-783(+)